MPDTSVTARRLSSDDWQAFKTLLVMAGWLDEDTPESTVRKMIDGAEIFGAESADSGIIAVGRGISDGCSDAYIQDVFVHPAYRGKGIGRLIVQNVIAALRDKGCDWIGLVATPGNENFYKNMGFETMKDHTPMFLKETR